jgi:hypothetical protein
VSGTVVASMPEITVFKKKKKKKKEKEKEKEKEKKTVLTSVSYQG